MRAPAPQERRTYSTPRQEEPYVTVAQGSALKGRTRWKRFATVIVPASFIAGAIVFGQATGAIAASFNVSGQQFKVSADKLEGTGFVQYGGLATEKGGNQ
jgi:hypothetical protein